MVSERDRILELIKYFESLGIVVNDGKNKARGNKGFFKVKGDTYRIDIAKGQSDEVVLRTLVHEFAHFIHYNYDKKLKSLDFIIDDKNPELIEELIQLTVDSIPKESIKPLFEYKEKLESNLTTLPVWSLERKFQQKALNSIKGKISRLNRYYNSPTELFARAAEVYILNQSKFELKAPNLYEYFKKAEQTNSVPLLFELKNKVS